MLPFQKLVRVQKVETLHDFWVRLTFTDGTCREVDLERFLHGPIFEPLRRDPTLFHAVRVDPRMGTLVWENGADIDPDVLYHNLTPVAREGQSEAVESI